MAGTFSERIAELRHQIGSGRLTGTLTVDQLYARRQHEELSYRHPRGGQAKYLQAPLMAHFRAYLQDYASTVLKDGGQKAMQRSVEHLSDQVELLAPREFDDLRHSGHPHVDQGGREIYDRPAVQARLTEEQLREKNRERWASLPDALKGWIYWHNTARGKAGLPPKRRGTA